MRTIRRVLMCALIAGAVFGACGGATSGTEGGTGSCAFVGEFRGGNYEPVAVRKAPAEGEHLGTAVLPACENTGGDEEAQDERIEVARLQGVPPQEAILWQGRFDQVLVHEGTSLPPEVAALMQPPGCDTEDAPVQLSGPWLGIIGPGQETEVDLKPPYRVDMFVEEASDQRYERALITVRVPRDAGEPLTPEDVRESLWKGGTIDVDAICDDSAYLAREIGAHPPKG